ALLRRLLGLGLPRGRGRLSAACRRALRSAALTESCIYAGTIRHRRLEPSNEFSHALALAYVDLEELPALLHGKLLARGPGPLRFRRRDYFGDRTVPLAAAVSDRVAELSGVRPEGPIRLLTQLRSWGMCFNPVSFYYCLDRCA
ncbi:MAG: hypothetical protein DLM64_01700, partial [Solirubrobacterales bacterium]